MIALWCAGFNQTKTLDKQESEKLTVRHYGIGMISVLLAAAETAASAGSSPAAEKPEWSPLGDMTIKKIGADPKDAIRQNATVFMGRIFGEASALKTKDAKNGDVYQYLIGDFRAVNAKGDKYESTKLFLPGRLLEEIEAALNSTGQPVEFGYDIFATLDESSSVGYKYAVKTVVKTEASDRVSKMAASVMAKPMPKVEAKKS